MILSFATRRYAKNGEENVENQVSKNQCDCSVLGQGLTVWGLSEVLKKCLNADIDI